MNGKRTANVERANREKINRRKKMTKMMRNHRESGRERERNMTMATTTTTTTTPSKDEGYNDDDDSNDEVYDENVRCLKKSRKMLDKR